MTMSDDVILYRVFLVEEEARVCVGQYDVPSVGTEAERIECALNDACADTFGYFEVWHGTRCIATVHQDMPRTARVVEEVV